MKTLLSEEEFKRNLRKFTGTEQWFRHAINKAVLYTEGAQYVAEACGAYWLLNEIALTQLNKKVGSEDFQVWKLTVKDSKGVLTCEDGNGKKVYSKKIPFTDFPYPEVTLWFEGNVILLPSEH